jgi:hypothetical protein
MAVCRLPEPISDTQRWLEERRPKNLAEQPAASPVVARFSNVLRQSLDVAEALGLA